MGKKGVLLRLLDLRRATQPAIHTGQLGPWTARSGLIFDSGKEKLELAARST